MDTPYDAISLEVVPSTQDEARAGFRGTPLLVTARRQTQGRGRRGDAWQQADRAVAASLAFRLHWPMPAWPRLPLVAGLAARTAAGSGIGLAWPNDLVLDGVKVGGLIAESGRGLVVVGFGLNLYWPNPLPGAGALHQADPGSEEAERIAGRWARELLGRVSRGPDDWGLGEYLAASATLGQDVVWEPGGAGRAVAITEDGGLVVQLVSGERIVLRAETIRRLIPAEAGSRIAEPGSAVNERYQQ